MIIVWLQKNFEGLSEQEILLVQAWRKYRNYRSSQVIIAPIYVNGCYEFENVHFWNRTWDRIP